MKRKYLALSISALFLLLMATVWAQDYVERSAYYQAPYGVYRGLTANNRLGLGTTSPQTPLDIIGNNTFDIRLEDTDAAAYWEFDTSNGGHLDIYSETYGSEVVRFMPANGYVGIAGTASSRIVLPNTAGNGGEGRANAWNPPPCSYRWKENITDIDTKEALEKIPNLRPVSFTWKPENGGTKDIGFIAEEVAEVIPEAVSIDDEGLACGLSTHEIVIYLTKYLQYQQQEIDALKEKIARVKTTRRNLNMEK
ncbi:MAG: tail fiber domain-containing protein [Candidatus Omnitrophica bacterium]|nr:tail fiber domain-containing protein [Candidatus Omnitrophota bacterium]